MENQQLLTNHIQSSSYTGYETNYQASGNESNADVITSIETPKCLSSKYTFIREKGSGSQGHVYEARRNSDGAQVAIKELRIDSVKNWKEYELFQRESKVLSTLKIDGVAKFYESLEFLDIEHPAAYIVQEYIQGRTLDDMLKSGYRFTLTHIYHILIKLVDILEKLHTHRPMIIHRDIKPSNIIMSPKGGDEFDLFLIDFGAVSNPQVQSGGSTVAGTFGYMPPEQLMGRPVPASDIYSLGALAVHLITGVSPADMQVKDFHLVFEPYMQSMPNPLLRLLASMLEPSVDNRQCDYAHIRKCLQAFAENRYIMGMETEAHERENYKIWNSEEFEQRLTMVETLGSAGNMEIWQRIPSKTPRSCPRTILNAKIQKHRISTRCLFGTKLNHKADEGCLKPIVTIEAIFSGLLFLIGLFVGGLGDAIVFAIVGLFVPLLLVLNPVGIVICIIVGIALYHKKDNVLVSKIKGEFCANGHVFPKEKDLEKLNDNNELLKKIITMGTKTIATIIDIQYVPIKQEDIESLETLPADNRCTMDVCHNVPTFLVRYKFNPPDDASSMDLIHEILIHDDPDDVLNVGDPLPILYLLEKNTNQNETVYSTPFPFALKDIVDYSDIIGESKYMTESNSVRTLGVNTRSFRKKRRY